MLPAHLIPDKVTHVRRCGKFSKTFLLTVHGRALPNVGYHELWRHFDAPPIPDFTKCYVSNRASYCGCFTLFSLINIGRDDPIGHDTANAPCAPSNEREKGHIYCTTYAVMVMYYTKKKNNAPNTKRVRGYYPKYPMKRGGTTKRCTRIKATSEYR